MSEIAFIQNLDGKCCSEMEAPSGFEPLWTDLQSAA